MLLDPELHYLDNAATTMVDPEIAGAIHEALLKDWANPSSLYEPAVETHEALTTARGQIARTLGLPGQGSVFYLLRQREQQPCRAGPCHGTQKLGQQNCGFRF